MARFLRLALLSSCFLFISCRPLRRHAHRRQLPPAVQISWANSSETPSMAEMTIPPETARLSFFPVPTSMETVFETRTMTVYEEPKTTTVTVAPITVTHTSTVSKPFTATPGSSWSAPAHFSNLESFKIAHFATGEKNLQITNGIPLDEVDNSLGNLLGSTDMEELYGPTDTWNSTSALQLLYPEDSINPGNSPQGGADFYSTPIPLADASNVTLVYSVFFPEEFDWVRGGKLPGLYGGHMTCSGGDDATSCFSTRLMWREGGAGELYLYAPKDKQTYSLCHAPPESVCDADYGLSIGRGSFKFAPGAWTDLRQTVSLNTPGQHDGGFRLEVNGKLIMDLRDVFYRDVPSSTESSSSPMRTGSDDDADTGGLLSPLIGGVLKDDDKAGVDQGVLPPIAKGNDSSTSAYGFQHPLENRPPLLPTVDPASALMYSLTSSWTGVSGTVTAGPTITQIAPRETVTITNYLWKHAFTGGGQEKSVLGIGDGSSDLKPITFSGLFFSTFFGGSSEEYATPKDQYTWFKDFSITINS